MPTFIRLLLLLVCNISAMPCSDPRIQPSNMQAVEAYQPQPKKTETPDPSLQPHSIGKSHDGRCTLHVASSRPAYLSQTRHTPKIKEPCPLGSAEAAS
jgi:hypothetical protein